MDEDTFLAADESTVIQELIDKTMTAVPFHDYVQGENDVPVSLDATSDNWEEEFFGILILVNPIVSDEEEC